MVLFYFKGDSFVADRGKELCKWFGGNSNRTGLLDLTREMVFNTNLEIGGDKRDLFFIHATKNIRKNRKGNMPSGKALRGKYGVF